MRWMERRTLSVIAAAVLLGAAPAQANVDYEDQSVGPLAPGTLLSFDGPLFILNQGASEIADGVACAPSCPANGTKYQKSPTAGLAGALIVQGTPAGTLCAPDCNPFDLLQIDVAEPTQSAGPIQVLFTPFRDGGSVGEIFTFETDGVADGPGGAPDFETVTLPEDFRDVDAIAIIAEISVTGTGFAIDNLVTEVSGVPAVGSWGLLTLAAAIAGVAWRLHRGSRR